MHNNEVDMTQAPPSKDSTGSLLFKHIVGTTIGGFIGAAAFALAYKVDPTIMRNMFENQRQAAATGGLLTGLSFIGTGKTIYDFATKSQHKKYAGSFTSRIEAKRAQSPETNIGR